MEATGRPVGKRTHRRVATRIAIVLTLIALSMAGCSDRNGSGAVDDSSGANATVVAVVNYPLQYMAERIGGDVIEILFPVPNDADPAHWMPDRQTIRNYQRADLILLNGASYAKWLDKVSLPESKLIDTSKAFKAHLLKVEEIVTHSHGKGGEHSHTGTASHTWLNPRLAVLQAEAVRDALSAHLPENRGAFEANFDALKNDLLEIDAEIDVVLKANRDRPIVFSHPIYQYFQQRFAVNSRNLHWEPGEFPEEKQWQAFDKIRQGHPFDLVIWEGPPIGRTVEELNRRDVMWTVVDPCANRPAAGDFLEVMRENVSRLKSAFSE